MHKAALIALVQLSLATAVSDDFHTLTATKLKLKLSSGHVLSPFYESGEDTGVKFARGSRAADSPLSPDIDVQCSGDFIDVSVKFADIFDGIIYSEGYLNDPKCKYVSLGGSQSRYLFRVPLNGCGSRPPCNACGTIDNLLVFQADNLLQGSQDFTRKVSCVRSEASPQATSLEVSTGVVASKEQRCPQQPTTATPNCYPGSSDPQFESTATERPGCYPGSPNSSCPQPQHPTTLNPPKNLPPSNVPNCNPGSANPRCPRHTTPEPPRCFPGSTDPRCPKPTSPFLPPSFIVKSYRKI